MASDPSKPFDPLSQFAEFGVLWSKWANPLAQFGAQPFHYAPADPVVQEIVILATMHNLASLLQNPGTLKAAVGEELAARARSLTEGLPKSRG